jgi:hypothetical protein
MVPLREDLPDLRRLQSRELVRVNYQMWKSLELRINACTENSADDMLEQQSNVCVDHERLILMRNGAKLEGKLRPDLIVDLELTR